MYFVKQVAMMKALGEKNIFTGVKYWQECMIVLYEHTTQRDNFIRKGDSFAVTGKFYLHWNISQKKEKHVTYQLIFELTILHG